MPSEQVRLHGRSERDDLVGVHVRERLLAEELLHVRTHRRDARRATHEDDAIEPGSRERGIFQRAPARDARSFQPRHDELVEPRACEAHCPRSSIRLRHLALDDLLRREKVLHLPRLVEHEAQHRGR